MQYNTSTIHSQTLSRIVFWIQQASLCLLHQFSRSIRQCVESWTVASIAIPWLWGCSRKFQWPAAASRQSSHNQLQIWFESQQYKDWSTVHRQGEAGHEADAGEWWAGAMWTVCVSRRGHLWRLIIFCDKDVARRIGLAAGIVRNVHKIWKASNISKSTKVLLYQMLVQTIILYNSENWTLKEEQKRKLSVFK